MICYRKWNWNWRSSGSVTKWNWSWRWNWELTWACKRNQSWNRRPPWDSYRNRVWNRIWNWSPPWVCDRNWSQAQTCMGEWVSTECMWSTVWGAELWQTARVTSEELSKTSHCECYVASCVDKVQVCDQKTPHYKHDSVLGVGVFYLVLVHCGDWNMMQIPVLTWELLPNISHSLTGAMMSR